MAARTAADGKWVGRIARTAADGVGATEWLEMGGENKHGKWFRLAMCAYRLTDKMDARGWGQGMGGDMG